MCDIWKANANGTEIATETLSEHLGDLQALGVRQVLLSGGEALMHSNLWSLCRLIRQMGASITLLSTGLLLKRHAEEVVKWCDEVIVSLDGSPGVHDKIRDIPRAFERLAQGVAAIRATNANFPMMSRTVLQRLNFEDFPNIVKAGRKLGLDRLSFLAADVSTSAFNRPGGLAQDRVTNIVLTPKEVDRFEDILDESFSRFEDDYRSGFIAESPHRMREFVQYFRALNGDAEFPEIRCNAPWVSGVIEPDGDVKPCFFHPSYGNLRDGTFEAIINGREAIAFRKSLDIDRNPICAKCVCTLKL